MYGLIVENWTQYITTTYGEEKWEEIRRMANIEHTTFNTHSVYSDNYIPRLTDKACKILNVSEKELLNGMGKFFVSYIGQYGYDRVLSVLGRNMRDFLNGLDNLHEYLKFSYPRMKAPSFFCENETPTGLILHYRSTRRGFLWYTVGQIREVGSHFYNTEVKIEVIKEETVFDSQHVMFQLTFDNRAFQLDQSKLVQKVERFMLPIKAQIFLEIFPFCIVFDQNMAIKTIGNSLRTILPAIVNCKLLDIFDITRPLIECTWRAIQSHTNNIFELTTVDPVFKVDSKVKRIGESHSPSTASENWGKSSEELDEEEIVGYGQQQSAELKLALDQELIKSRQLEDSMRKLDIEMKRTDELLYQMIPKQVADRLRKGEPAVDTCQFFDSVTILFSDVVTFTEICSRITPMQVVSLLNSMYSLFDQLTEKHGVYKVETIGDAYMVVSGAPEKVDHHAEKICQMALDMIEVIGGLKDPSTDQSIKIRVGVHSGAVVAGVVGLKMPRYCLFGDAVNCASRMESTSEALKIHISEKTKELLVPCDWEITERGKTVVKGKGEMKTFWLLSRTNKEFSMAQKVDHRQSEIHLHEPIPSLIRGSPTPSCSRFSCNSVRMKSPIDGRPSPATFEEVTRFTPAPSPPISVTSTYNDPVITYTEPLNQTASLQGQIKVTDTSSAPVDGVVTKVGNYYVCQKRLTSQGPKPAWGVAEDKNSASHSQFSQTSNPTSGCSRPSINRCCNHCHFGGQIKQLSDLVSQHHSILKENAAVRTAGTLVPYVPHQSIECCPRNRNHDHYRSQTCVII